MSKVRITNWGIVVVFIVGCQQQHQTMSNSPYRFTNMTDKVMVKTLGVAAKKDHEPSLPVNQVATLEQKAVEPQAPIDKNYDVEVMKVTAYCPCATCCGWKTNRYGRPVFNYGPKKGHPKKVGYTSTGAFADIGTIAADTSYVPYGTKLYVQGYGFGVVEDTGGSLKGNHIDIFFHSHAEALRWGVRNIKVAVWQPQEN